MRWLLLASLLATGGCTTTAAITCVPNVPYSERTLQSAADELESMRSKNEYPTTRRFITDYGNTREANRRCAARKRGNR